MYSVYIEDTESNEVYLDVLVLPLVGDYVNYTVVAPHLRPNGMAIVQGRVISRVFLEDTQYGRSHVQLELDYE